MKYPKIMKYPTLQSWFNWNSPEGWKAVYAFWEDHPGDGSDKMMKAAEAAIARIKANA